MADSYVTAMDQMEAALSPGEDVPAPARRFALYLGDVVRAATALEPGRQFLTPLPCRRRPRRKPCPGRLTILRAEVPPQIYWACPSCEENGLITDWRGTWWDFTSRRLEPPQFPNEPDAEARLSEQDYRMLRKHVVTARLEEDLVVAGAQLTSRGILVRGPLEYMEDLLGSVAAAANHAPSRYLQRRLDTLYDRVVAAVEDAESRV